MTESGTPTFKINNTILKKLCDSVSDSATPKKREIPKNFGGKHAERTPPKYETLSRGTCRTTINKVYSELEANLGEDPVARDPMIVGDRAFFCDNLSGAVLLWYWFSIPKLSSFEHSVESFSSIEKKNTPPSHEGYVGRFATLENLFAYLLCVMNLDTSHPLFKDVVTWYYGNTEPGWKAESLRNHFETVTKTRPYGGYSNPVVPIQLGRAEKTLKHAGCMFYATNGERSKKYHLVQTGGLLDRDSTVSFPTFNDFCEANKRYCLAREEKANAISVWKDYIREHGEEAAQRLLLKIKDNSKRNPSMETDDEDTVNLTVTAPKKRSRVSIKKPKLVDEDEATGSPEYGNDDLFQ